MTTGQLIRAARKKAGLTQAELANKLGVPYQSVSQWERSTRYPKIETIARIANAVGAQPWELTPYYEKDYGLENPEDEEISIQFHISPEQKELNNAMEYIEGYVAKLNRDGKLEAVKRVSELTEIPRYRREEAPEQGPPAEALQTPVEQTLDSTEDSTDGKDTPAPPDAPEGPQKPK